MTCTLSNEGWHIYRHHRSGRLIHNSHTYATVESQHSREVPVKYYRYYVKGWSLHLVVCLSFISPCISNSVQAVWGGKTKRKQPPNKQQQRKQNAHQKNTVVYVIVDTTGSANRSKTNFLKKRVSIRASSVDSAINAIYCDGSFKTTYV